VRVLGIESSSRRGTVALVEDDRAVVTFAHEVPGGHAERLLGMVGRALAEAGWTKASLDRVAVGVGPGSFTGIRVGIALAQGIALGLGCPVLGVGSLRAMCRMVPDEVPGTRCALLDARREEVFCAEYDATGVELRAPVAVRRAAVAEWLAASAPVHVVLGEAGDSPGIAAPALFRSEPTILPHALGVALVGSRLAPAEAPAEAAYGRPADAIRPNLPRSPLSSGVT
jgi:tRNA threonylcarbamoyladenosine biosynthesis protein TsaB